MSSKRPSMMPPAPKPPTALAPSLCIAEQASLGGKHTITLGPNTVIHPRAKLNSANAPITIGSNCIVCERSQTGLQVEDSQAEFSGVEIKNGVIIEAGAVVEASIIGEGCHIEVNAKIGKGAVLGKYCKIAPFCIVADGESVPDYTVIYGNGMRRKDRSDIDDLKLKMVAKQVDVLKKLIPSNLAKFQ